MGLALLLSSCKETIERFFANEIEQGEEVLFTTAVPNRAVTRSAKSDYEDAMGAYQAVNEAYEFTVNMYAQGGELVGSSTYCPAEAEGENTIGALIGKTDVTPLYWSSTTTPYAFEATAGTAILSNNQTTKADWLKQDLLKGYGYIQKWNGDDDSGSPIDKLDALNYHTAKEWRSLHKEMGLLSNDEDYKRIPLYLQHKRSLITVILKAGEGVSRQALDFEVAKNDLSAEIYSYDTDQQTILPLASEKLINYENDKNGDAQQDVSTTCYDAIVEPHNYADGDKATTEPIVRITLSGQHYTFNASNDANFDNNKESYNLSAGKHLILTVTLGRTSREVHMTAYIENWTEQVTNTICDDYGNAGVPIKIKNRDELIDFLQDADKNKAGNIALITADIDLEATSEKYGNDWSDYNNTDLNCSLSLGGKTLLSNHRFVNAMSSTASLQNGTIQIGGTVDAAIATTNNGTIDDVKLTAMENTDAYATIAGAVVNNAGTISRCHSSLRVQGDSNTEFVGGIAATSLSTANMTAAIDACTVSNSVKGGQKGGGIVGKASGYITNNTFEYGITLLQSKDTHKNIVGQKDDLTLNADNNAWPTVDDNLDMINATAAVHQYNGIIDDETELRESVKNTYNAENKRYRLAQNIIVNGQVGSISYELDGNNKQISTKSQIFETITGQVHDLAVYVTETLKSNPTEEERTNATDGIAPLAFEVHGEQAEIKNVKVTMADGTKIQASNPAGLVVWAWGGATVSGCEAKVNLYADVNTSLTQGRKFAGGIVSTTSWATVTQCVIHSGSTFNGTASSIIYYGGIVGGIEHKEGAGHNAEVTITDCTSFLSATEMPKENRRGAIIGDAMLGAGTTIATKGCQGNWWNTECNGAGAQGEGNTDETVLGKRNGVTPQE